MPANRQDLRRRLAALAATQSGHFSAAQALGVGYSYQSQKFHADRGNWQRIDRGLFRLPEWPVGKHDDLVRWSLWSRGRAVVSYETALSVHDLGDVNPAVTHLTVPLNFRQRAAGVELHKAEMPAGDVWQHEGYRVTTPIRTLLDIAAGNVDLDHLAAAIDDASTRWPATRRDLLSRADDFGDRAALRIERALQQVALP
ncbi:MAG: type IV toxin-antitoxin system AbiEi family antitoxin domain-containing protein [Mycobacteriales bacterium]